MEEQVIRIMSIKEVNFNIDYDSLPKTKQECEETIKPSFSLSFSINENESCLVAAARVDYLRAIDHTESASSIISLEFLYNLFIDNINKVITSNNKDGTLKMPNKIIEILVPDLYSTGRALLKSKIDDTILSDFYLPFGGSVKLVEQVKANNKSE